VAAIFRLSGLQRDRLMLRGMGGDAPRAANDSVEGRALNRRVELLVPAEHHGCPAEQVQHAGPCASDNGCRAGRQASCQASDPGTCGQESCGSSDEKAPAKKAAAKKTPAKTATPAKKTAPAKAAADTKKVADADTTRSDSLTKKRHDQGSG
jgi:hypothetical protein